MILFMAPQIVTCNAWTRLSPYHLPQSRRDDARPDTTVANELNGDRRCLSLSQSYSFSCCSSKEDDRCRSGSVRLIRSDRCFTDLSESRSDHPRQASLQIYDSARRTRDCAYRTTNFIVPTSLDRRFGYPDWDTVQIWGPA